MKAILINPFDRTIIDWTLPEGSDRVDLIHQAIDADCFCTVRISATDHIYLDDTGLFVGPEQRFFKHAQYPTPLAGRGLIMGCDMEGESIDCSMSVEDVAKEVNWVERHFQVVEDGPIYALLDNEEVVKV